MNNLKRRRRLVVDKAAQTRMIVSVAWPPALFLLMSGLALAFLAVLVRNDAAAQDLEIPALTPLFGALVGFFAFAMGFIGLNALRVSFRVAGPTFKLKRTLEAATGGDYSVRARLRDGDYLGDLADSLNTLLESLEQQRMPATDLEVETAEPDATADRTVEAPSA